MPKYLKTRQMNPQVNPKKVKRLDRAAARGSAQRGATVLPVKVELEARSNQRKTHLTRPLP